MVVRGERRDGAALETLLRVGAQVCWGKVVVGECEEEVIALGQISSREGKEGGNKGGGGGGGGRGGQLSEERGSLSLSLSFCLCATCRLPVSSASCLLGFLLPRCAGGWLEEFSVLAACPDLNMDRGATRSET